MSNSHPSRNDAQAPVPADHPLMKAAWEAHKKTEEYANSLKWALLNEDAEHVVGSLWACFMAGFKAASSEKPAASRSLTHGDTSPCIDRDEQIACDWAYDGGDPDTGVAGCWTCATCGCVDINREPPSDY